MRMHAVVMARPLPHAGIMHGQSVFLMKVLLGASAVGCHVGQSASVHVDIAEACRLHGSGVGATCMRQMQPLGTALL